MIVKELDVAPNGGGIRVRAGRQAEEQMAFYLRRAFGGKKDVYVFNGLRLQKEDGDTAQIDHLVMHRLGLVLVESKSVYGRVRVNERGEWTRTYRGQDKGMASPIEQAKRQAAFLVGFLDDHAPEIGDKTLGLMQSYFGCLSTDVVVAVSDSGIIEQPAGHTFPEVCKADQASARIEEVFARQKRDAGFSLGALRSKRGRTLSGAEMANLVTFLPARHQPAWAVSVDEDEEELAPVTEATSEAGAVVEEHCATCGRVLTPKVVEYCREQAEVFGGKLYCFDDQKAVRAAARKRTKV